MNRPRVALSRSLLLSAILAGGGALEAQEPTPPEPPLDTGYVIYDSGPISLPLGIGLRVPSYNRVDGVAVPWGPHISLAGGRIEADPTATYRSNLGAVDPYIDATVRFGARDKLEIAGGRSTFSNDKWIRSDIVNSLGALGLGTDARNYFRADRGTAFLSHEFGEGMLRVAPGIGFLHEYAWSTGVAVPHSAAPWSLFGRTDTLKMRRVNPAVLRGHTTSGLAGVLLDYEEEDVFTGEVEARAEHAFETPSAGSSGDFTQYTIHAESSFPTFGVQRFSFRGHGMFTSGDAPPQRFAYLGGGGTLATVDLLALGGDRLLFVEGEYEIPLRAPLLPFVGAPVLTLRYAAGSAGVGDLPDFIQNIGLGVGVRMLKAQYHIDPSYQKTSFTSRSAFSVGLSLSL